MLRKILLVGMVMGLICSASIAADEPDTQFSEIGFEVMKDKLILDDKGDDYLLFCTRRLDVTSYTLIKNESGMIIPFEEIEVPCEAIVNYYEKPGEKRRYVALSIEVRETKAYTSVTRYVRSIHYFILCTYKGSSLYRYCLFL